MLGMATSHLAGCLDYRLNICVGAGFPADRTANEIEPKGTGHLPSSVEKAWG